MKPFKALFWTSTAVLLLFICLALPQFAQAQIPTLGIYPATTVIAGRNTTVTPSAAPTNTLQAVAYTSTNFTGVLTVDPVTGVVRVTDALQAGTYTVTVRVSSANSNRSTTFALTVTNPTCSQGSFVGTLDLPTGARPGWVAIGDFNGDTRQDFIASNGNGSTVSIRLGDGLGGFNGTTNLTVGAGPSGVAVGDFNGDGKQDFAVANVGSTTVSIGLGNGLGGFGAITNVTVGSGPRSVAIGDLNGDGNQDLAVTNMNTNDVSIRLGNGLGGFSGTANFAVGSQPNSIVIGDFNADGKQDFAVANYGANTVSVCLGDGSGGIIGSSLVTVGSSPWSIALGDFNRDGRPDFATANFGSDNLSIRLGNGSGGFVGSTNLPLGTRPISVAVGDFNGDGMQDLAATRNLTPGIVGICLGNGLGSFSLPANVTVGDGIFGVAVGNFNGDGSQDIAVASGSTNGIAIRLGAANEINIAGNGLSILDGDVTPSIPDNTDFGTVNVGFGQLRTFTIQNVGLLPLNVTGMTATGAGGASFTFGTLSPTGPIAPGGSATVTVRFMPTSSGVQAATIHVWSDDCDEGDYDFAVIGWGAGCDRITCVGHSLSFTATATNGLRYDWDFGDGTAVTAQTPFHSYATPGTYPVSLLLSDANGCTSRTTQTVCVYPAPSATYTTVQPSCNGSNNGAIDITVSGGVIGGYFTYLWSSGQTTQDLAGLSGGTYTVTISDPFSNCTFTQSVTLTNPAPISMSITPSGATTFCQGGSVTLTASSGFTGYAWSNGATTQSITVSASGTYGVTVTNAAGCSTTTAPVTVTVNPKPVPTITANGPTTFCAGGAVMLTASTVGSYLWSTGATTQTITVNTGGTYAVTVTNASGCQGSASQTVTVNPLPVVAIAASNNGVMCFGSSVTLTASAGFASYAWSGGGTTNVKTATAAGTYTVTVTNTQGCSSTASSVVTAVTSCAVVTGMNVTNLTQTSARLNWTGTLCATTYTVQYRVTNPNGPWTQLTVSAPTVSLNVNGLLANRIYQWQVRTNCSNGSNSGFSAIATFTTPPALLAKADGNSGETTAPEPTLFPNPNDGKFTVIYHALEEAPVEVCVWDMNGKRVFCENKTAAEGENTWEMHFNLASGVYFFRIEPLTQGKAEAKRIRFVVE